MKVSLNIIFKGLKKISETICTLKIILNVILFYTLIY